MNPTLARLAGRWPHWVLLALLAGPALLLMPFKTWFTLTLSGLAMGVLLFLMASGLTLSFGLMSVLNLAHGAFISLGAFAGATVLLKLPLAAQPATLWGTLGGLAVALGVAALAGALCGLLFERLIIRPVYDDHLKQILVTVGGAIILVEIIQILWGSAQIPVPRPALLRGAFVLDEHWPLVGGIALERYRMLTVLAGLLIYALLIGVFERTRIGLLIRAAVENREGVEIQGYSVRWLFLGVFVAGAALAGMGGVLWALYQEVVTAPMGNELLILAIVVIVLGGLGSIRGCFYGSLMVGLINLYVGFLAPPLASVSSVGLMVVVLLWRPQGLIPVLRA